MRDVYQMLHQFDKMKENFQRIPDQVHQEIKTYIDSILNEIQVQYDQTIEKLRDNWSVLKGKLHDLGAGYNNLVKMVSGDEKADSEDRAKVIIEDILQGVRVRVQSDIERFTVIFIEKKLAVVYIECEDNERK